MFLSEPFVLNIFQVVRRSIIPVKCSTSSVIFTTDVTSCWAFRFMWLFTYCIYELFGKCFSSHICLHRSASWRISQSTVVATFEDEYYINSLLINQGDTTYNGRIRSILFYNNCKSVNHSICENFAEEESFCRIIQTFISIKLYNFSPRASLWVRWINRAIYVPFGILLAKKENEVIWFIRSGWGTF